MLSQRPHTPSPMQQKTAITHDTIVQRQELQKSLLKHSNRLIDQLLKNLDVADNLVKRKLSPSHIERQINYLRADIEPLRGFISRISLHAQNLGAMKKEHELQGAFTEGMNNLYTSLSSTGSDTSSVTRYLLDRNARTPVGTPSKLARTPNSIPPKSFKSPPKQRSRSRSPPFYTPRKVLAYSPQRTHGISKSCSPVRFNDGDCLRERLSKKDSSDQVDFPSSFVDLENLDWRQIIDISKNTIYRKSSRLYRRVLKWLVYWKFRLTGSKKIGVGDSLLALIVVALVFHALHYFLDYLWLFYKSKAGVRRGVRPM